MIFFTKSDSNGNLIWAKSIVGTFNEVVKSMVLDSFGSIYTTGVYGGTADFDPGLGLFNLTGVGGYDIFICKIDSAGNFRFAKSAGGSTGIYDNDYGSSLALNTTGDLFVTGYFFSSSVSFASILLANTDISGATSDVFIAKLDHTLTGIENKDYKVDISIYPNPSNNYIYLNLTRNYKEMKITIIDITGKIIKIITNVAEHMYYINTSYFEQGIYLVQIQTPDFIETKKFIIIK